MLKMSRSRTARKSRKCERQVQEKDAETELLQRHPEDGNEMAPLLRLMSFYGSEQLHNVQLGNVGDSRGEIFGPLVTFSRGLLRNRAAACWRKGNPLEFVLNRWCHSNTSRASSLFPDDCLHRCRFRSNGYCRRSAALQLRYSAKSTITKYIKNRKLLDVPVSC